MRGVIVASTGAERGPGLAGARATALTPVANRPLLLHALSRMRASGIDDVVMVSDDDAFDAIVTTLALPDDACAGVQLIRAEGPGFAPALTAVREWAEDEPLVIQQGDGLLAQADIPLGDIADSEHAVGVLAYRGQDDRPVDLGLLRILRLSMPDAQPLPGLAAAGIWLFGASMGEDIARALEVCGPDAEMPALVESLASGGARVTVQPVDAWHRFSGQIPELLRLNHAVLEELPAGGPDARFPGTRLEGRVCVHPTAHIESSVIRGPVVIGAGSRIADSYVGPYTTLGEGVHIEGAEIENSMILSGASVLHLGRRLEGSVVGSDARITRRFSLPRGMMVQVGDGTEVAIC